jgi:hypothetical protein
MQRIVKKIAVITDQENGSASPSPPDVFGSPPQLAVRKRNIQYCYLELRRFARSARMPGSV